MMTLFFMSFIQVLTLTHANPSCLECTKMDSLLLNIKATQTSFLKKKQELAKVVLKTPTEEAKAFEQSIADAYKYVCDFNEKTPNKDEKKSLLNLVTGVYELNIENALAADMFQCFYQKHKNQKAVFTDLAKQMNLGEKVNKVLIEGKPDTQ